MAFPAVVRVVRGRLRTPLLLADPSVTATALVVSAYGDGCRTDLRQGVPRWLDCPVRGTARIVVTLSDGRTVTRTASG